MNSVRGRALTVLGPEVFFLLIGVMFINEPVAWNTVYYGTTALQGH